jgi:4,5-DOPA dioxygenase extradiol
MELAHLQAYAAALPASDTMPALFIGHGNPMNAIWENQFTQKLRDIPRHFEKPAAIAVLSAHWETHGVKVAISAKPRTIHDFYGFPKELYTVQYPAIGHPELAAQVISNAGEFSIQATLDTEMGLDHGAWTVLKYMYPMADIPVFQISLNRQWSPLQHLEFGKILMFLRKKGVLVLGSGNIVHNLRLADFKDPAAPATDWALEFDSTVHKYLQEKRFTELAEYRNLGNMAALSIPTPEHYLPMLTILGMAGDKENVQILHTGFQHGSISMRCFSVQ